MIPRGHSRLAMSKAGLWLNCAGGPREIAKCPPQAESPYAKEGVSAHALGEHSLRTGTNAFQHVGGWFVDRDATAEMAEHVQVYLDAVRAVQMQMGPEAELVIEIVADATHLHDDLWGRLDAGVIVPFHKGVIFDFKYGVNPVEADCDQGIGYALALSHAYDLDEVVVGIVQPRASHPDGPVRFKTWTSDMLREQAKRFAAGAMATDIPDAPLTPGWWCKKHYCENQHRCPALHQHALAVAQVDFATPEALPVPAPKLNPKQLRRVLDQAHVLEGWLASVQAFAMAEAMAGRPPEGYKLVAGRRGNREWKDEAAAAKALSKANVDPWISKLISPAVAEKKVPKTFSLDELTTRAEGKPALVRDDDPRPAISAGPDVDFKTAEAIQ